MNIFIGDIFLLIVGSLVLVGIFSLIPLRFVKDMSPNQIAVLAQVIIKLRKEQNLAKKEKELEERSNNGFFSLLSVLDEVEENKKNSNSKTD